MHNDMIIIVIIVIVVMLLDDDDDNLSLTSSPFQAGDVVMPPCGRRHRADDSPVEEDQSRQWENAW